MSTMVRLNSSIRDYVIRALLNKKFVKQDLGEQKLAETEKSAAEVSAKLAYEAAFTKDTRKILTEAAPGMFPFASSARIRIENSPGNYYDKDFTFGENKPVPFRNSYHGGNQFAAVIPGDHPLAKALKAWEEAKKELEIAQQQLREEKSATRRKLETVINSVTTVKRLVEVWPEVQEFLPEVVSGNDGGVPAVLIADLNKEFGL